MRKRGPRQRSHAAILRTWSLRWRAIRARRRFPLNVCGGDTCDGYGPNPRSTPERAECHTHNKLLQRGVNAPRVVICPLRHGIKQSRAPRHNRRHSLHQPTYDMCPQPRSLTQHSNRNLRFTDTHVYGTRGAMCLHVDFYMFASPHNPHRDAACVSMRPRSVRDRTFRSRNTRMAIRPIEPAPCGICRASREAQKQKRHHHM